MTDAAREVLRADLAAAGIVLEPRDLEAAARIAAWLAEGAVRVRAWLDDAGGDASG